jgi:hypothetical protein
VSDVIERAGIPEVARRIQPELAGHTLPVRERRRLAIDHELDAPGNPMRHVAHERVGVEQEPRTFGGHVDRLRGQAALESDDDGEREASQVMRGKGRGRGA